MILEFQCKKCGMVGPYEIDEDQLKEITPHFGIFLNEWKIPLITMGGTVHCSVREPHFTLFTQNGISMADWLKDAVEGKVYDVGLDLLKNS